MKNLKSKNPVSNSKFGTNRQKPENKDNLDSREVEEQLQKGNNITHNTKERKNGQNKRGNKN